MTDPVPALVESPILVPDVADDRTIEHADRVQAGIRAGLADNTWRAYEVQWARFLAWCDDGTRLRTPIPATIETLLSYVQSMIEDDLSPSTIRVALAAIKRMHGFRSPPAPWAGNTKALGDLVVGYQRRRARDPAKAPKRADGARTDVMRALVDTCDPATPAGCRDRAILLLGYSMAARRSELANLTLADLRYQPEGLEVYIAYSKTDQVGDGVWVSVPTNTEHPVYCAVRAVQAWVRQLRVTGMADGPLFRPVDRSGNVGNGGRPLSGTAFEWAVRRAVIAARTRAADNGDVLMQDMLRRRIVPHSLRRGFATDARDAEWDVLDISRHGRWSPQSRVVHSYIEESDRWKRHRSKPVKL